MQESNSKLIITQKIGLYATTALVIGNIIGSGIFVSPASMARHTQSVNLLFLTWIIASFASFFGALSQAELASRIPKTGGLYEYFKTLFGDFVGFSYGWAAFSVAETGSIAAIAYIFAAYFGEFVPLFHLPESLEKIPLHLPLLGDIFPFADLGLKLIAASVILFLTFINTKGIKIGAGLQSLSTTAKSLAILLVIGIVFFFHSKNPNQTHTTNLSTANSNDFFHTLKLITLALSGAFWSFSGWGTVPTIAGEVKNPQKNIPKALIIGLLIVTSLYLLMNYAYVEALGISEMANAENDRVASKTLSVFFGDFGAKLIASLILLSTFDCLNSTILLNARTTYAMATEKRFFKKAAVLDSKTFAPKNALWIQAFWIMILLFSGSFDLLTETLVFVNWCFYVLIGIGVFVARKKAHKLEKPAFKVPFYPWIPLIFTLFCLVYTGLSLYNDVTSFIERKTLFLNTITGLLLVFSGAPFYFYFKKNYKD